MPDTSQLCHVMTSCRHELKEARMATSVGFIGVGNMGNPMASNVLKAGFPMIVYDRNPQAMENLLQAGPSVPPRCARSSRVQKSSSLRYQGRRPDVEAVYLEPGGLVDSAKPGTILIDLSSVLPSTPRKIEPRSPGARRAFPGSAGQRRGQRCTRQPRWRSWWGATPKR